MKGSARKAPRPARGRRPAFRWAESPAAGQRLREVLWPLAPSAFLEEYWGRRPLLLRGWAKKFSGLFGFEQLEVLLGKMARHADPLGPTLRAFGAINDLAIRPEQVRQFVGAGNTICMTGVQRWDDVLSLLCESVQRDLNYPGLVQCNAYWALDGGFAPNHFDARVATTLQISGRKRWRYAASASIPWPLDNGSAQRNKGKGEYASAGKRVFEPWERFQVPDERGYTEVVLEPGDLLCLPAGLFHSVQAIGHSLAINLGFEAAPLWSIVGKEVERRLRSRAAWRSVPPTLGDWLPGGAPGEITEYLEERIAELQAVVSELDASSVELVESWRAAVVTRKDRAFESSPIPLGQKVSRPRAAPIRKDQLLGFPHTTMCRVATRGSTISVTLRDGKNTFVHETDSLMVEFFRRIVRAGRFTAESGRAWVPSGKRLLPWKRVQATLGELVESGALCRLDG